MVDSIFFFDLLDFFFSFMNVVSALTTSGSAGLKTGWFTFEKKILFYLFICAASYLFCHLVELMNISTEPLIHMLSVNIKEGVKEKLGEVEEEED